MLQKSAQRTSCIIMAASRKYSPTRKLLSGKKKR